MTRLAGLIALFTVAVHAQDACKAGEEALARRDLDVAEAKLRQCLKTAPPKLDYYLWLCGVHQLRRNEEGLYATSVEGLKKFPGEKRFYLTAGTYAGRAKRFAEGVALMDAAFERWPADPPVRRLAESLLVGRGKALLDQGDNAGAEKHLKRAVAIDPQDVEARMNLGRALHNLHRGTEAVAVFEALLAQDPKMPLARFHRGLAYYALGEFSLAIDDMTAELAVTPGYPPAHLTRGLSLIAAGEWEKALQDLDPATQAMPADAKAHYGRGRCLARLGRVGDAEAAFRRSAALDPQDPGPLHALARLLVELGRKEEAAPLAERAAALNARQRAAP